MLFLFQQTLCSHRLLYSLRKLLFTSPLWNYCREIHFLFILYVQCANKIKKGQFGLCVLEGMEGIERKNVKEIAQRLHLYLRLILEMIFSCDTAATLFSAFKHTFKQ